MISDLAIKAAQTVQEVAANGKKEIDIKRYAKVEISKEADWEALLRQEEDEVKKVCDEILRVKPDVVITEKGVSDLAQHFLLKGNCTVIRRIRKTDNNRIARCAGATIVNRAEELTDKDVGTRCGLFQVKKIGD